MRIFGFDYPDDCFYFLEQDMWCRSLLDGRMQVGVTDFGTYLSGDFYMCRPRPSGTAVVQGGTMGVVELSKTIMAIKSPISGTIDEVNPLLEDTPEIINKDMYGRGWLVNIKPDCWQLDMQQLSHGDALAAAATARMRIENIKPLPEPP